MFSIQTLRHFNSRRVAPFNLGGCAEELVATSSSYNARSSLLADQSVGRLIRDLRQARYNPHKRLNERALCSFASIPQVSLTIVPIRFRGCGQ